MPRLQRPYYALHQILTGQFTDGSEFVLGDGTIYAGSFHILPSNQRFTGFQPEPDSRELFELRLNPTADILKYNQINQLQIQRYLTPTPVQPNPTLDDYKFGKIERFLIQKRNNPKLTIMEIDAQQFNSINTRNSPGINGIIWNKIKLEWIISKIPKSDAAYLNQQTILTNETHFAGITTYLTNPLEFYK